MQWCYSILFFIAIFFNNNNISSVAAAGTHHRFLSTFVSQHHHHHRPIAFIDNKKDKLALKQQNIASMTLKNNKEEDHLSDAKAYHEFVSAAVDFTNVYARNGIVTGKYKLLTCYVICYLNVLTLCMILYYSYIICACAHRKFATCVSLSSILYNTHVQQLDLFEILTPTHDVNSYIIYLYQQNHNKATALIMMITSLHTFPLQWNYQRKSRHVYHLRLGIKLQS